DVETARIVTATVVTVKPGEEPEFRDWLADPGVDIPAEATAVHGITTGHAREHGQPAHQVVSDVNAALHMAWSDNLPVVAFNALYDLTVVDRELRRHYGLPLDVTGPVLDPYVIDRGVDRFRKGKRTLGVVCEHYGVKLTPDEAHTSHADALAAVELTQRLAKAHAEHVGALGLRELWTAQCRWHHSQSQGFARYLRQEADGLEGAMARGDRSYVEQKLAALGVDDTSRE